MPVKKVPVKKQPSARRKNEKAESALVVPVFSIDGKADGNLTLPKELFGVKVNKALLLQAMRVYLNNRTGHYSHTKTRAEVQGSTAKMGPQKGSGKARHGSKRAPIFVGGGIALGPKSRQVKLELPKKMRAQALLSALSQRLSEKAVYGLAGSDKASGKTKQVANLLSNLAKKKVLLLVDKNGTAIERAARNLPIISVISADQLNAFDVINCQNLLLTQEAVKRLQTRALNLESGKTGEAER